MQKSNIYADNPTIIVPVPPNRLRWLCSQLDAAGIPFELDEAGNLTTLDAAEPIINQVLGYRTFGAGAQLSGGRGGLDLLSRRPENRSRATDAIGFGVALALVYGIVSQSARIAEWAAGVGLNPATARGAAVFVSGLLLTLFVSEVVIGRGDNRRWMFVLGMMGLFLAAATWFVARGMGVL